MIDVDGVRHAYDEATVLDGVDLQVRAGEFLGLVGPNGAGKTTLLRTINGLVTPDAGTVRIDGDRVAAMDAREVSRRVATVPQEATLRFPFSVAEVVEMGRTPHRSRLDWSDAADAVGRALARTGIQHLAERPIDEVSGGERQRVLLARALAQEAPILALDEPTASLDVNHQLRVLDLVSGLVDEGRTAVAAIHDLDLAARYCDRLALLHEGEIVASGPPASVLRPEPIRQAFDTDAAVAENAVTGTPRVTAVGDRPVRDRHVHVVGGGRPAARALGACWRAGFDVSVGVVPKGDVAAGLAADLDATAITAPPFDSPDYETREAVGTLLTDADVVVLTTDHPDPATAEHLTSATATVDWPADGPPDELVQGESDAARNGSATDEVGPIGPGDAVVDAVMDELAGTVSGDD